MYSADASAGEVASVAIIGAGASGTLTCIHLLRAAAAARLPLRVALIDRNGRHGRGEAYSTTHPEHLLNSPADTMSTFGDDPEHLVRWAARKRVRYDGFLPRSSYGDYLCEVLADAERQALPWGRVTRLTCRVVGIRPGCGRRALRLDLAADGRIDADVAVLATGCPSPAPTFPVAPGPRYVADPWEPAALNRAGDGSLVIVAGSGPTMVDVAIALTDSHPATKLVAVSRHGLLPLVHSWPRRAPGGAVQPLVSNGDGPLGLARLIRDVRESAERHGGDWQDVVDALRPRIPDLWQRLSARDQRQFLRHVARYWEVHRHRMPPATARRIGQLRASGRLTVLSGRIASAQALQEGVRVSVDLGGSQAELQGGWLVNCSGSSGDVTATGDMLYQSLFAACLARPYRLRLGLDVDSSGRVLGGSAACIYALGPLLRGVRYETTAIPEIREQAAVIASRVLEALAQSSPRSAA